MSRSAAWVLSLLIPILSPAAWAGDGTPASGTAPRADTTRDTRDFISAVTGAFDENPHSCFEADDEQPRPDLASRPRS